MISGIQAGSTWIEPGVSAQDEDGNNIQVSIGGDVVNPAVLGVYTITYTAVTAAGDIAESKTRFVTVIDTTSPVLSIGSNISLTVDDTWAGETAGVHYSAVDNLDGNLTSQIAVSGWDGDTSVAGTSTRTYTVQDAGGNVATASKSAVIAPPFAFNQSAVLSSGRTDAEARPPPIAQGQPSTGAVFYGRVTFGCRTSCYVQASADAP